MNHKKKFTKTDESKGKVIRKITHTDDFILILFDDDTYCHLEYTIGHDYETNFVEHEQSDYLVQHIEDAIEYEMITKEEGKEIIEENRRKRRADSETDMKRRQKQEYDQYLLLRDKYEGKI